MLQRFEELEWKAMLTDLDEAESAEYFKLLDELVERDANGKPIHFHRN